MIKRTDRILTAYAQSEVGPGWSNSPVYVIVRDNNGNIREECIQPECQTPVMNLLYGISQSVHAEMTRAVMNWQKKKGGKL